MKTIFKKYVLFLVTIAFMFGGCSGKGGNDHSGASGNDTNYIGNVSLTMRSQLPTVKVLRDEDISSLDAAKVDVSLAKGETEGGQIIVRPDADVKSYSVTASDLVSGNNVIDSSNVSIYTLLYSYAGGKPYGGTLPSGDYPDAAIPVEKIVEAKENTMTKNLNQGFWVDVKAPKDAAAGNYSGNISISCDGKTFTVPVSVKVFDFTLNDYPFMQTCYLIWQGWLMYGEHDSTSEKYMDYYDMLTDFNICAYTFPHNTTDEFISYVRQYYPKISSLGIPYDPVSNTQNDWDKFQAYMDALGLASVEDGVNYFEKAYYYLDLFYDEYQAVEWRKEAIRNTYAGCDRAEENTINMLYDRGLITDKNCELAQSIRDLRHAITASYDEEFSDIFNSYCPGYSLFKSTANIEEVYRQITEDDIVYWSYGCVGTDRYPCSSREINENLTSTRDLFWFDYEYDITGDLYWCVNGYCNWSNDTADGYAKINDLYTLASHEGVTNGDGYLVYPGAAYNSEKPFPSVRLIAIRDGIDDHTYMCQLGNAYKELSTYYGADVADAKGLVSFLNRNIISKGTSQLNDAAIQEGRSAIANAIMAANDCKFVIDELSLDGNDVSYKFYSDKNSIVKINGNALEGSIAGSGYVLSGKTVVNESAILNIEVSKGGATHTISVKTPKFGVIANGLDDAGDIADMFVYTRYGSSISLNTDPAYSIDRNSAKAILSGYYFTNATTTSSFKPCVTFNLGNLDKSLSELSCIEFYVYNPETYDCRYEVFFTGTDDGLSVENRYDVINCKACKWTKVVIDNFSSVNLNRQKLNVYNRVGLRTESNLLSGIIPTTRTVYVDKLIVR